MSSESFRKTAKPPGDHRGPEERVRAAGLRATAPRLAILALLERDRSHPSAHRILELLKPAHPSLSLSTVYETLEAFLGAGLCRAVTGDGALMRVDGTTFPHDHAVCRTCGRILDVAPDLRPRLEPPARLPGGHEVHALRVEYEVVCATCARRAPDAAPLRTHAGSRRAGGGAAGRPGRTHTQKEE